tara:strand:+ start:385 stop:1473 length:1089 start_codon:yes stop_codon:yes gene_type:complete
MNISSFISIASKLPPHIAILMRGSTGIGKSAITAQISQNIKKPLIDVRGSTMTEGDVGGYPDVEGMKKKKVMTFCMPSWFIRACEEPVVLFLDELNRSLPAVQQAFFQIVLDRCLGNDEFGNAYQLHPETRIFAAVNHGSEYDVNEMDPALLRRFWTVDIHPSPEDWFAWAKKNNVDPLIIEFLTTRTLHLAPEPSSFEPGSVFPTPASWTRFDESLKFAGIDLLKSGKKGDGKALIFNLASGFIGNPTAIEFSDFVEKYEVNITPEDILNRFDDVKEKVEQMSNDRLNLLIERLAEYGKTNDWDVTQGENASKLGRMISEEMLLHMWNKVTETKNMKTIQNFHKFIGNYLVEVVNNSKNLS